MIQLKLNKEAFLSMYFDEIKGGQRSFSEDGMATITHSEFEDFLKANNLIPYHNMLKAYETGEVFGEFELT